MDVYWTESIVFCRTCIGQKPILSWKYWLSIIDMRDQATNQVPISKATKRHRAVNCQRKDNWAIMQSDADSPAAADLEPGDGPELLAEPIKYIGKGGG